MNRNDYITNKNIRPEVPYRELIVFDAQFLSNPNFSPMYSCLMTVYRKENLTLGIAHEHYGHRGSTIGEGARVIWPWFKDRFSAEKHICVQGHNGFYEYVNIWQEPRKTRSVNWGLDDPRIVNYGVSWSPAGTIEDVLRNLE